MIILPLPPRPPPTYPEISLCVERSWGSGLTFCMNCDITLSWHLAQQTMCWSTQGASIESSGGTTARWRRWCLTGQVCVCGGGMWGGVCCVLTDTYISTPLTIISAFALLTILIKKTDLPSTYRYRDWLWSVFTCRRLQGAFQGGGCRGDQPGGQRTHGDAQEGKHTTASPVECELIRLHNNIVRRDMWEAF